MVIVSKTTEVKPIYKSHHIKR